MTVKTRVSQLIAAVSMLMLLTACAVSGTEGQVSSDPATETEEAVASDDKLIEVGFSQLGAESDWRSAHTESMKSQLTEDKGFRLLFEDAQQKQANQIMAIRTFIQQEVDYIVLAPVTETGWETVLSEAKEAGIPVILVDRMVDVEDDSLFTCWVGSDFKMEGMKATEWLYQYTRSAGIAPEELHIVNIQGTIGSSAQIGRSQGLREACENKGWDLMQEISGEFTQTRGREVMSSMLKLYSNLNVVYCENDNEALGAIEAIEAAGKKPGMDIRNGEIMVLSFDGMNPEALQYCAEGKIACIAECNPDHGKRIATLIHSLENGEQVEKYSYISEEIYSGSRDVTQLVLKGRSYPVTFLDSSEEGKVDFVTGD